MSDPKADKPTPSRKGIGPRKRPPAKVPMQRREKAGQPPKRSDDARERIKTALRLGAPLSMAAEAGGMSVDTLIRWRHEDPEFDAEVRQLQAEKGVRALARIEAASRDPKHWQAAAWLLERRWPSDFGRKNISVELSGKDGSPITVETGPISRTLDQLSRDDLEALLAKLPVPESVVEE